MIEARKNKKDKKPKEKNDDGFIMMSGDEDLSLDPEDREVIRKLKEKENM